MNKEPETRDADVNSEMNIRNSTTNSVNKQRNGEVNQGFLECDDSQQEKLDINLNKDEGKNTPSIQDSDGVRDKLPTNRPSLLLSGETTVQVDSGQLDDEWWGCRHTLALLSFFGMVISYALRVNLSIAIIAMVDTKTNSNSNQTLNQSDACPVPDDYSIRQHKESTGEFDWDERTQGLVLGAFYWGYTVTNFPAGRAAEHFGGRLIFGLGIVLSSLLTLVSPFCARVSKELFIAVRVMSGVAQGGTFSGMVTLLGAWIIPKERSKFTSFIYTGAQLGTVLTLSISGWLISSNFLGGWPSVFYVFGVLGMLWGIPWFWLVSNRPETHPRISQKELKYIQQEKNSTKQDQVVSIPWKAIGKSLPFWSVMAGYFGNSFGFFTILNGLPTYLSNILYFDIRSNGLFSSIPYIGMIIMSFVWGSVMNVCLQKGQFSIRTVRRLSTAVGCYGPMICLVVMTFVQCDATVALVILCAAVTLAGANYSGYTVSNQDIAPNLSGTLMGITNTMGALTGILAPSVTGLVTQGNQTPGAWHIVFFTSSGILLVCTTFYIVFVTEKIQYWNNPKTAKSRMNHYEPETLA